MADATLSSWPGLARSLAEAVLVLWLGSWPHKRGTERHKGTLLARPASWLSLGSLAWQLASKEGLERHTGAPLSHIGPEHGACTKSRLASVGKVCCRSALCPQLCVPSFVSPALSPSLRGQAIHLQGRLTDAPFALCPDGGDTCA